MASLPSPGIGVKRPRQLTLLGSFVASSLAACTACLFTNPMEVIKTRLQLDGEGSKRSAAARQYRGILHAMQTIGAKEGIRGLQAGLSGALAYQTAMNGVRLGLYEPVQRALVDATGAAPSSVLMKASAGAISGALGATLGSPIYMIKSRLQAQRLAIAPHRPSALACAEHSPGPHPSFSPSFMYHQISAAQMDGAAPFSPCWSRTSTLV